MGIDRSRARRPTQHARAEGAAQAIEGQYRALLEAIPDLIFHLDGEGRFLDFVLAKGQELALRPAEFLGRTVREVMPTDLARQMMHHIDRALQTGEAQVFEYRIPVPLPDGNPRDYEARIAASAKDEVVAIVRDITRSRRTRDALRESDAKYRQVFEHVHDVFYRADTNGAFTEISPSVEWWGYDAEQLIGAQVSDVYQDPQGRSAFLSILLEEGRVIDYEVRLKTGDGRLMDASVSSHLLRDRDGVVVGIEGIARDITERKRAEQAIRESEERVRTLVTNAPVVLFAIDREGVFTVNEGKGLSGLGLRPGQNVGRSVFDVYRDVPEVIDAARRALAGESSTATVELAGGLVFEAHYGPLRDQGGRVCGAIAVGTDVTERKRAEEALRESEERFRRLAEDSIDGILLIESSEVRFANAALVRMFGYESDEEILGRPFTDFVSEGYRELMVERGRARNEGLDVPDRYEFRPLRRDGSEFDADISVSTITYQGRQVRLGMIRDITERKRAEEALRESETKFRTLTETAAASIFIYRGTKPLYVNAAMETLTGYTREEILAAEFWHFVHPDSQSLVRERSRARQQREQAPSRYEFKIVRKSGEERWVDFTAGIIEFEGHLAVIGTAYDITERKRAEQALMESEDRFRRLSEATLEGIVIHDGERILDANPQAAAMVGYELSELIGMDAWRFLAPDCHDLVRQQVLAGYGESYEVQGLRKDGTTFPMEVCGKTAFYDGRQVRVGVMRDISERKRAEEALRESENRFRTLSEAGFEGIAIHDKGTIVDGNQAFASIFRYELSEAIGMHVLDFVAGASRELVLHHITSKYPEPFEFTGLTKDGLTFPVEVCGRAIPYQGKMVTVAALRDLTERKQMEEALQKAREELEARVEHQMERGDPYGLTFRELTVLYLMAAGRADKEIAFQLGISSRTASKHVENILQKMGVASRTQASVQAFREGLVGDVH